MKKPDSPFDDVSLPAIGVRAGVGKACVVLALSLLGSLPLVGWAEASEEVKGRYCYTYGDEETPAQGKKKALALARERAVENHQVFISNKTTIENFQLKEDLIQSVSAGMLKNVTIQEETEEGRTLCVGLVAQIEPSLVQEEIGRRMEQRELKKELVMLLDTPGNEGTGEESPGLKIWLNKSDGSYREGDNLIVYVQAEQDMYLKLDYFQADGKVVHLVPNFFRGQAFIEQGKTYEFGGPNSPEQFMISGPYGDETIKALTSTRPFTEALESKQKVSESKSYLQTLKRGLDRRTRGVTVMAGATAALHTRSHEEIEHLKAINDMGQVIKNQ
jgi:hypothetical protein